jgi:hypothetical protein
MFDQELPAQALLVLSVATHAGKLAIMQASS